MLLDAVAATAQLSARCSALHDCTRDSARLRLDSESTAATAGRDVTRSTGADRAGSRSRAVELNALNGVRVVPTRRASIRTKVCPYRALSVQSGPGSKCGHRAAQLVAMFIRSSGT